jgi:hypothetical protein
MLYKMFAGEEMTEAQKKCYTQSDGQLESLNDYLELIDGSRKRQENMLAAQNQHVVQSLKGIKVSQQTIQKNQHIMSRNLYGYHKQTSSSLRTVQANQSHLLSSQRHLVSSQHDNMQELKKEMQEHARTQNDNIQQLQNMFSSFVTKQNNSSQFHSHQFQPRPQLPSSGGGSFHHLEDPWRSPSPAPGESEPSLPPIHLHEDADLAAFSADFGMFSD